VHIKNNIYWRFYYTRACGINDPLPVPRQVYIFITYQHVAINDFIKFNSDYQFQQFENEFLVLN